jgi:hypothetical protein
MPDEHDNETGREGPRRPDQTRRRISSLQPTPAGNVYQQHLLKPDHQASTGAPGTRRQVLPPDPRFADAPLTDAERKSLSDARTKDEFCELLGSFQEARREEGRLPQSAAVYESLTEPLSRLPVQEQIAKGIRPTPDQLAHIHAGANPSEKKSRMEAFLEARTAQNEALFYQSRHWGAEIARQAGQGLHNPEGERLKEHGAQGWRADVAELRDLAYRPDHHPRDALPLLRDFRFADAPLNNAETEALKGTAAPKEAAELLGRFHNERLQDGRLSPPSPVQHHNALLFQAFKAQELDRLGLKPTERDLAHLGTGTVHEAGRTRDFILHRQVQNARWQTEPEQTARQHAIAGLRDLAHRTGQRKSIERLGPSRDSRFEDAPLSKEEIAALKQTKEPEKAIEHLNRFQQDRIDDGRVAPPARSGALLFQAFDAKELDRLGLTPTQRDFVHLKEGAAKGQEIEYTREFIRDRQAQNARWFYDAEQTARAQERLERGNASSYWYTRFERAHSDREARTERAERRTDIQMKKDQADRTREGGPRTVPGKERDGREDGGRER